MSKNYKKITIVKIHKKELVKLSKMTNNSQLHIGQFLALKGPKIATATGGILC